MIKKLCASLFTTLFLAGIFGTLAGCNTMEGAGKDIERGGQAIKDEAREQRNGQATAYVCEHYVCQAPTTDPEELRALLHAE